MIRLLVLVRRAPHVDVSRLLASGRLVLLDRWDPALSALESREYLEMIAPGLAGARRAVPGRSRRGWIGRRSAQAESRAPVAALAVIRAASAARPGLGAPVRRSAGLSGSAWIRTCWRALQRAGRARPPEAAVPAILDRARDSAVSVGAHWLRRWSWPRARSGALGFQYRSHGLSPRSTSAAALRPGVGPGHEAHGTAGRVGSASAATMSTARSPSCSMRAQIDKAREVLGANVAGLFGPGALGAGAWLVSPGPGARLARGPADAAGSGLVRGARWEHRSCPAPPRRAGGDHGRSHPECAIGAGR